MLLLTQLWKHSQSKTMVYTPKPKRHITEKYTTTTSQLSTSQDTDISPLANHTEPRTIFITKPSRHKTLDNDLLTYLAKQSQSKTMIYTPKPKRHITEKIFHHHKPTKHNPGQLYIPPRQSYRTQNNIYC